ncbi:hypothetical protein GCM10023322_08010 [Rugosimonospora acidiphila]|uniref:CopC domain-containing protein n=1 Tax=Rugosimonospora acidiphila TaxID=556531 RepID=A0ABP9RKI1_9ACTN
MRRHAAAALFAVLFAAVLAGTGAPAWAGPRTVASTPADGAVLSAAPSEVELSFTGTPDPDSSHAAARTGSGTTVPSGPLRRVGRHGLRLPVTVTAHGDYLVAYHVEFTDGTDLVGAVRFSVGTAAPPALADAVTQGAERQVAAAHHHDIDPLSATLLVVDGFVLLFVILLLRVRRPPRRFDESGA